MIPENINNITNNLSRSQQANPLAAPLPSLLGASKGQSADKIREAYGHRVVLFGENKVQEAKDKWPALKQELPGAQLHLIGPLQSNKAADAVALFDVIQTLDRPKLADVLAKEMTRQNRFLPCFIQVNTGEEPQKAGIAPQGLGEFVHHCRNITKLPVSGLMCIPPADENPAPHFALMHQLAKQHGLSELSMGMSDDYDIAARFGSTIIRLGRGLFGERE